MEKKKPKILIIEDSPTEAKALEIGLNKHGYELFFATSGEDGLDIANKEAIDLVLLDIELPGIDGFEVCKRLKENEKTKSIFVIILTVLSQINEKIKGLDIGANDYIAKPFDVTEVIARVKTQLRIKELQDECLLQNKKLIEFDKQKSDFVSKVSHEIRNPLAVISTSIAVLEDQIEGPLNEAQKTILKNTQKNIKGLINFAQELLDLSKIETGKMTLNKTPSEMKSLVDDVLTTYDQEFLKKDLKADKNLQENLPKISVDPEKIKIVFSNLISNAIKFTPNSGNIKISLSKNENELIFEISDSGCGINPKDLGKIFDKFERAGKNQTYGTGLGLPIAKDIVLLHNGKIDVKSDGKTGSTFIVFLPY
jgi:two-component system, sensor histidine kinase and response regulator